MTTLTDPSGPKVQAIFLRLFKLGMKHSRFNTWDERIEHLEEIINDRR